MEGWGGGLAQPHCNLTYQPPRLLKGEPDKHKTTCPIWSSEPFPSLDAMDGYAMRMPQVSEVKVNHLPKLRRPANTSPDSH